ncbi:putative methyltransferase family protein [Pseudoduganella lurida]|uniref:Putative methyltransferase family protein n=1 Tax=Pseudoduganella lurida TaxID=1036180 RepID=A0A562QUW4_9BURK|nr:class I SAM-dependent methyltransferase [Pseudoduganella lurida]TWI60423.1 putative methyltransferase family protein [Pseudoduganella lurida]
MPEWSAGYVADIGYTYGTYAELNPHRARLAFVMAGLMPPKVETACELGFGQGMSINLHGAASTAQWHGTDFNPTQAVFARELAAASGAPVHLYDQSFAEFCSRDDLPDFDFIGLHGIFSWISDENRRIIADFVRRKLRLGGVLYISYNTQPGWAPMVPVRELLAEYANVMGAPGGGSAAHVDQSLAFAERLFGTKPGYLLANPNVAGRFDKTKVQDRNYLAHEYFNRDWVPFQFSQVAALLEQAKLTYACSAHYLDHIDTINLTADQRKLLDEITDPVFSQTVRDFMVNQGFRRDYWVKGPRRLGTIERDHLVLQMRVMLLGDRAAVPLKAVASLGEVTLQPQIYDPLLDFLADGQPHTIGELVGFAAKKHGMTLHQVLQAVFVLTGTGSTVILQDDDVIERARPAAQRLNLRICEMAMSNKALHYLAAPATGGALPLNRFDLLFVLSRAHGGAGPEDWAAYAAMALSRQGERLVIEGKPAESDAQQLQELTVRANKFRDGMLPILIRVGAIA